MDCSYKSKVNNCTKKKWYITQMMELEGGENIVLRLQKMIRWFFILIIAL